MYCRQNKENKPQWNDDSTLYMANYLNAMEWKCTASLSKLYYYDIFCLICQPFILKKVRLHPLRNQRKKYDIKIHVGLYVYIKNYKYYNMPTILIIPQCTWFHCHDLCVLFIIVHSLSLPVSIFEGIHCFSPLSNMTHKKALLETIRLQITRKTICRLSCKSTYYRQNNYNTYV